MDMKSKQYHYSCIIKTNQTCRLVSVHWQKKYKINACRITANKRPRHRHKGLNTYTAVFLKGILPPTPFLHPFPAVLNPQNNDKIISNSKKRTQNEAYLASTLTNEQRNNPLLWQEKRHFIKICGTFLWFLCDTCLLHCRSWGTFLCYPGQQRSYRKYSILIELVEHSSYSLAYIPMIENRGTFRSKPETRFLQISAVLRDVPRLSFSAL